MNKKLTLRMDDSLIESAKGYAEGRGVSVSSLVENFFKTLDREKVETEGGYSPIVSSLIGILPPAVDESDYRDYLEDKYQ